MVLIVEDEAISRRALLRLLRMHGYESCAVGSAEEAHQFISEGNVPEVALLDIDYGRDMMQLGDPDKSAAVQADDAPPPNNDDDDEDNNYRRIKFVPGDLVTYDVNNGSFMFRQGDYELHLVRKVKTTYDWSRVF